MITLDNEFEVPLPVEQTWALLTDLPKVAQCLPGAHLDDVVDGEYRGGLNTKIGPISAQYQGTATFAERDDVNHTAVISARGRERKGSGSAAATVNARLTALGGNRTSVQVVTELSIGGKAAQFGRSLLAEVSGSLLQEFVRRLEQLIAGDAESPASTNPGSAQSASNQPPRSVQADSTGVSTVRPSSDRDGSAASLDVMSAVALPLLKRSAIPAGLAAVVGLLGWALGRRGGGRGADSRRAITVLLVGDVDQLGAALKRLDA